jgi:hypothetical protein
VRRSEKADAKLTDVVKENGDNNWVAVGSNEFPVPDDRTFGFMKDAKLIEAVAEVG